MNIALNFLLELLAAFLIGGLLLGLQRKIIARIQGRPGPPIIQHLIHTFKFYVKELAIPRTASMPSHVAIVLVMDGIWMLAVLFGPVFYRSIALIMVIYAIHKVSEHGIGHSSGSPYANVGSCRAVLSATAELPLMAAPALVYFKTKTLILSEIVKYQLSNGSLFTYFPLCTLATFILVLSKVPSSPFGITWGKDVVTGYKTEHFGVLRGCIMMGEILAYFVMIWLFFTVFFGGIIHSLAIPVLGYVVAFVILAFIIAFICAITPMLAPYHSVMVQWIFVILALLEVIMR